MQFDIKIQIYHAEIKMLDRPNFMKEQVDQHTTTKKNNKKPALKMVYRTA